jgi:hypothetical protein
MQSEGVRMERCDAEVPAKTQTCTNDKGTGIQTNTKPGHKRSELDVIDSTGEGSVSIEGHRETHSKKLATQAEFQSTTCRSSDVVDYLGNKHDEDNNTETIETEIHDAVSECERPTTLDVKPTVSGELGQKKQEWMQTTWSSKEVIDATPCTPPETSNNYESDSR